MSSSTPHSPSPWPRRAWSSLRRHPIRAFFVVALAAFCGLNVLAFRHAGALTRFDATRPPTRALESLSLSERAQALLGGASVRRPENNQTPAARGLAFTTHLLSERSPQLEVWRIPREQSRGVVLLCHGYAGSKASLLPAASEFHALGFSCVLLDFRGSGGSEGNQTSLGVHEAEDVARAAAFAQSQELAGRPLVVFGTSMGAAAALRAVHLGRIEPARLILEAPFNRLLVTLRHRFEIMGVPSFPSAELLLFWGSVRAGFNGFEHDPQTYAASVRCQTLVIHGESDARVSVAEVREVLKALPAESVFELLEGVGHEPFLQARPEAWRRAVSALLAGLS